MTFESIVTSIPGWLTTCGPESSIVISSRARLARNIAGINYPNRVDDKKFGEVVNSVLDTAERAGFDRCNFFRKGDLDDSQKSVFIERHLISPLLASSEGNLSESSRGVLVMDTECCSIMVNEEDHIRLQSICAGFDPMGVVANACDIEDKLSQVLSFSFSPEYGYLTACPTNMGTGLRVSVLIHLPALVITKEIQRVIRSAGQLGMAVRGYRGEGSDVVGNLFQISNQTSLGKTEHDIAQGIQSVVNQIIDYEKHAADMLVKEAKKQIEDKIWRSLGILKTARVLSTHEFMNLSSAVRLGQYLGLFEGQRYKGKKAKSIDKNINRKSKFVNQPMFTLLNELMILTQPGHLQERIGRQVEPGERDVIRADFVRERFIDVSV